MKTIIKQIKQLYQEIRDPYPRIRGNCVMCGNCCRSLILTYKGKPVYSMKEYKKLLRWDRDVYERFEPDVVQPESQPMTFTCKYQVGNRCSVHESRPLICKTYPHRSIFGIGAVLENECGYRIVEKGSFEDILEQKKG